MGPAGIFLSSPGLKTLELRCASNAARPQAHRRIPAADPRVADCFTPASRASRPCNSPRGRWTANSGPCSASKSRAIFRPRNASLQATRLFQLAVSLGAVESLIEQPASMSHASYDRHDRCPWDHRRLIRLSVGLEAFEDLRDDLDLVARQQGPLRLALPLSACGASPQTPRTPPASVCSLSVWEDFADVELFYESSHCEASDSHVVDSDSGLWSGGARRVHVPEVTFDERSPDDWHMGFEWPGLVLALQALVGAELDRPVDCEITSPAGDRCRRLQSVYRHCARRRLASGSSSRARRDRCR